ncbi:hypothetical protein Cgig2_003885 [Carnegiea gigantea]|uniref:Uncharacterized protein n=1 Tax=Carnegiea gigantea TaxID=171969 RepID=A0A9Q1JU35_9CARY|nr:hypothetical protein Cgig2_003885 [Carnegiea gigantea]
MSMLTYMWQGVRVHVWDGYMEMKHVKGNGGGGGCSDRGKVGATVSVGDVACGVDGGVVTDHFVRDSTEGSTGEGQEVDEAAVVEELIHKQKLWVYDYVSDCYKAVSQSTIYMNSIHPMETHDFATVDDATGLLVGGEALDDGYNRRILPPLNPHPQGRHKRGELNLNGKASRSESAQNAESTVVIAYSERAINVVSGSVKIRVAVGTNVQDEVAWDYFCLIDPDFPERAKEVIDDLLRESALERDWVLDDRSAQLWSREEDMRMDAGQKWTRCESCLDLLWR